MAAARKRSGGMSPVEWAVAIGGFSLFVIGVVLVIVVASMRGPATVEVARAPAQPAASPVVAPSAPAAPNPYAPNPYSPGPPPPTAPPTAPPSTGTSQPQPQGEVIEVVAQRMERSAPTPEPEERSFWGSNNGGGQHGGSRRWILRQWWGPPLIMLLCILGGGYTMLAAVVDSDAVFVHGRHAPHIADLFGRPVARIYYFCLGGVVMFFGLAPLFAYFR